MSQCNSPESFIIPVRSMAIDEHTFRQRSGPKVVPMIADTLSKTRQLQPYISKSYRTFRIGAVSNEESDMHIIAFDSRIENMTCSCLNDARCPQEVFFGTIAIRKLAGYSSIRVKLALYM